MHNHISNLAILVEDYDRAIEFYTQALNFELKANIQAEDGHRWVQLAPANSNGCHLIFNLANNEEDRAVVGKQAGSKVLAILETDDFWRDYKIMQEKGVTFTEAPREEEYGTVVIFKDLYGNKWDLIETKAEA